MADSGNESCLSVSERPTPEKNITAVQRKRAEQNRQRAILLRKSRLISNPLKDNLLHKAQEVKVCSKPRDTGGGFFLEDDICGSEQNHDKLVITYPPAPLIADDRPTCMNCNKGFGDSYLSIHFNVLVCDNCRDKDGKHSLITKTDAKKEYLLKDCDLDKREPILKFILKKNPHYSRGEMKLYLRCQVEERALEIYGSDDKLEEAKELRDEDRIKRKQKAFDKRVKALRMSVRSSLYRKDMHTHQHEYGPETYRETEDVYEKTCTACGHKLTYEKM